MPNSCYCDTLDANLVYCPKTLWKQRNIIITLHLIHKRNTQCALCFAVYMLLIFIIIMESDYSHI